jgi:2-polyprenyl-3-methyl-5-hydroxy-6-metoxy-1,4-benzoquinol methylase
MKITTTVSHISIHLDESKLQPPESECPFCGFSMRQQIFVLQKKPEVLLLKCATCHAASASRMPTDDALKGYYDSYYKPPIDSAANSEVTFDDPMRFGKHLADIILPYKSLKYLSILDFGGGDGSIANSLAMQLLKRGVSGVKITVIDYNKKTVKPQDCRISINKVAGLEDIGSLYSIVIASAIIEHLSKPQKTINSLLNCLEDEGIFYVRTPYVAPIMKICGFMGIKWDFTYPAHIHDLGQDFWETYFNKKLSIGDFQILESRPSIVETTIAKYFLRTVASYSLKFPWHFIGRRYKLVGGWEIFVRKNHRKDMAK